VKVEPTTLVPSHAQAVVVFGFGPYIAARQRLVELAMRYWLPTVFPQRDYVEAGGLMSYSTNLEDLVRRGAIYVDKGSVSKVEMAMFTLPVQRHSG
jgi:hypothetical protein